MKKSVAFVSITFSSLLIISCSGDGKKPASMESSPEIVQRDTLQNTSLESGIAAWVSKDVECYGVVVATFQDGKKTGKSVKCKVVAMSTDKIKMKALESVNLSGKTGCSKIGISFGDTWWETEGDIFQTREEADNFLRGKGWLAK